MGSPCTNRGFLECNQVPPTPAPTPAPTAPTPPPTPAWWTDSSDYICWGIGSCSDQGAGGYYGHSVQITRRRSAEQQCRNACKEYDGCTAWIHWSSGGSEDDGSDGDTDGG